MCLSFIFCCSSLYTLLVPYSVSQLTVGLSVIFSVNSTVWYVLTCVASHNAFEWLFPRGYSPRDVPRYSNLTQLQVFPIVVHCMFTKTCSVECDFCCECSLCGGHNIFASWIHLSIILHFTVGIYRDTMTWIGTPLTLPEKVSRWNLIHLILYGKHSDVVLCQYKFPQVSSCCQRPGVEDQNCSHQLAY